MIIRHVPDLGVGHVYGPSVAAGTHTVADGTLPPDIPEDIDVVMARESQVIDEDETHHEGDSLEIDDPELGLGNRETDILDEGGLLWPRRHGRRSAAEQRGCHYGRIGG